MNEQNARTRQSSNFVFRGNAVSAGGYLTRLNGTPVRLSPDRVTVHGESSLPLIGGVSHSVVEKPDLPYPDWIQYGRCETFVEGTGDEGSKVTTLRVSVEGVNITTRPSPEDNLPNVRQISFQIDRLSLEIRSVHPQEGQPYFVLLRRPETKNMRLVRTVKEGPAAAVSMSLDFDQPLLSGHTLDEVEYRYANDRNFFDEVAARYEPKAEPKFGDKLPRSNTGYVVSSIVKSISIEGKIIPGNVLVEPGFGRIVFGQMIADGYSRRVSLVQVDMGSDPDGSMSLAGVDTNGVWD